LCVSYINTHKKLVKLEKRCEEDRLLSGSLTEQREKGLMDAQKLMETLQKSVETLADVLNESMPALVVEMEENETMNANESSGVELYKKEDDRDVNLGPFDDDETKAFYCDIPDFLSTIPPALLGYTVDEVEKLRAANILRFKTVDFPADMDDSSNSNPDTDSFSQSGEGLDEVIADGSTLTHSENDPDCKFQ
jgi:regulator of nonsense transcripts 2